MRHTENSRVGPAAFAFFVTTTFLFSGCKRDTTAASTFIDANHAAIFKLLRDKSGRQSFPATIDLNLPSRLTVLRSNANILDQRTSALRNLVAKAQDESKATLGQDLEQAEQLLRAARTEIRSKEQELSEQENTLIRRIRHEMTEIPSYEAAYALIGEQLTCADKLLASTNHARRQIGFSFARETCRHSMEYAQNGWLAARIAETYLWPNLALADYQPGSKEKANDVLRLCQAAFRLTDETGNLIHNYDLRIDNAPTPHDADSLRLELADLLVQTGNQQRCAAVLREVKSTNLLPLATERLARLKSGAP